MLTYEKVKDFNLAKALEIQKILYPNEVDSDEIAYYMRNQPIVNPFDRLSLCKFWLIKRNDEYIGLTGLYVYRKHPKDIWFNWFGILPEYRQRGFGMQALQWTYKQAKKDKRYEYFRVYAEEGVEEVSIRMYKKLGMTGEKYSAEKGIKNYSIYTKKMHLFPLKIRKWNNVSLELESYNRNFANRKYKDTSDMTDALEKLNRM